MSVIPNNTFGRAWAQQRGQLRRYVKATNTGTGRPARSRTRLAEILRTRPTCVKNTLVWTTLEWLYWVNDEEIRGLLRHAGIFDEYRTVGQLTGRQVDALAHALCSPALTDRSAA